MAHTGILLLILAVFLWWKWLLPLCFLIFFIYTSESWEMWVLGGIISIGCLLMFIIPDSWTGANHKK